MKVAIALALVAATHGFVPYLRHTPSSSSLRMALGDARSAARATTPADVSATQQQRDAAIAERALRAVEAYGGPAGGYRTREFLLEGMAHCARFFDPKRCVDPEGGFYHFFAADRRVADEHSQGRVWLRVAVGGDAGVAAAAAAAPRQQRQARERRTRGQRRLVPEP